MKRVGIFAVIVDITFGVGHIQQILIEQDEAFKCSWGLHHKVPLYLVFTENLGKLDVYWNHVLQ